MVQNLGGSSLRNTWVLNRHDVVLSKAGLNKFLRLKQYHIFFVNLERFHFFVNLERFQFYFANVEQYHTKIKRQAAIVPSQGCHILEPHH